MLSKAMFVILHYSQGLQQVHIIQLESAVLIEAVRWGGTYCTMTLLPPAEVICKSRGSPGNVVASHTAP